MNVHSSILISHDGNAEQRSHAPASDAKPAPRPRRGQRLGYLVVNGQSFPVPCTVRDLGVDSATLILGGWLGIPEQFSLYVEPDEVRLDCRIAGRRGNAVTVAFDGLVNEARPRRR